MKIQIFLRIDIISAQFHSIAEIRRFYNGEKRNCFGYRFFIVDEEFPNKLGLFFSLTADAVVYSFLAGLTISISALENEETLFSFHPSPSLSLSLLSFPEC